jgi:paraquat-inducible protein A
MVIHPGPAALAFAGVVVLTMLAAMAFEPRLIWDRANAERKQLRGEREGEE